jgi:hypothetical protein
MALFTFPIRIDPIVLEGVVQCWKMSYDVGRCRTMSEDVVRYVLEGVKPINLSQSEAKLSDQFYWMVK